MIKAQAWGYNITSVNFPALTKKNTKKINKYANCQIIIWMGKIT